MRGCGAADDVRQASVRPSEGRRRIPREGTAEWEALQNEDLLRKILYHIQRCDVGAALLTSKTWSLVLASLLQETPERYCFWDPTASYIEVDGERVKLRQLPKWLDVRPVLESVAEVTRVKFRMSTPTASISAIVRQLHNLQHLELDFLRMGSRVAHDLARPLHALTSLTRLDLCLNQLGPQGVRSLAPPLTHLRMLEHLNVGWNNIGTDGCVELAEPLRGLTRLTRFMCNANDVNSVGAAKLGAVLCELPDLTDVELMYNKLDAVGVEALFNGWTQIRSLRLLRLDRNPIANPGLSIPEAFSDIVFWGSSGR